MRQFLFAALMLACGLAACSRPYDTPLIEGANGDTTATFEGLMDLAQPTPSSQVRMLWTHGMCRHGEDWSTNRTRRLITALGPGATSQASPPRPIGEPGAAGKRASLRRETFTAGNASMEVDFFFWAPLTDPYKDALIYDRLTTQNPPGMFKLQRASLNRDLKSGLLNDCLLDAVVYSGPNGHPIRKAMRQAVCEALGGTMGGGTTGSAGCDVPPGRSTATLVFISESLGSKMLFDAIVSIWDEAERRGGDAQLRVANALASTRMMFMVSNQVPLLDAAGVFLDEDQPPAPPGVPPPAVAPRRVDAAAPSALRALSQARSLAATRPAAPPAPPGVAPPPAPPTTGPLTLVAFSDPNDILSYHLVPSQLGGNSSEFRFVNVAVSNDVTYFGFLERPDTAHCGYAWNPAVLGLLIHGRHAGKPLPTAPALPAGSCF